MIQTSWPSAILLSLALATALPGCSKPSAEQQLQQARAFAGKGEKKSAIIELKNLLADRPDHAGARLLLGQLYLETGETDAASIELKKAIGHGADPVAAASMQAQAYLARNEPVKALAVLDQQRHANTPRLLALRAQALVQSGKIDEAEKLYQSALQGDPGSADAALGLARLALLQRRPDQAMARVDAILQRQPRHIEALLLKADLLRSKGDKAGAKAALQQVIAADKTKAQAWLGLIALAIDAGQTSEARSQLAELRKIGPDSPISRHFEALILVQEKKTDQALAMVLDVLKSAPGFPASNLLAAHLEFNKGLYQQAITHLNTLLGKAPGHLPARRLLIATLLKQGELDKANVQLAPLLEQHPDDAALLGLAGEVAVRRKDYAKAMDAYSRAARIAPQNTEVQTRLAMTKLAAGESSEGLHDLEQLAIKDDKAIQADMVLALTHINKQQWPQAEAAVKRLASKQPDSPLPGVLRASILLGGKDMAGARKELETTLQNHPGFVPAAVNLARMDLADKQPEKARQRFEALLAKDGKNVDLIMAYAELLQITGKASDAQAWLEKARQARPDASAPALALTAIAMHNKDYKRALGLAQEALAKKPDNPQLLDNLAHVQLLAGEHNQAVATLGKLLNVAPNFHLAYVKLANAQSASGNQQGAIGTLQKAIAISPSLEAYLLLGSLYLTNGQNAEAMKMAQTAQRLQPKSAAGYLLEGDIRLAGKLSAEAGAAYLKANSIEPSSNGMIGRYRALVLDGKQSQAEAEINKWLADYPNDLATRATLAGMALQAHDFAKASSLYESLLKSQPANPVFLNNLAYSYHKVKDARAMATVAHAVKLLPDNPEILDTLAVVQLSAGKLPEAMANAKKAQGLAPENVEIRFHYAQALIASGRTTEAKKELELALTKSKSGELRTAMQESLKQLR